MDHTNRVMTLELREPMPRLAARTTLQLGKDVEGNTVCEMVADSIGVEVRFVPRAKPGQEFVLVVPWSFVRCALYVPEPPDEAVEVVA